MLQTRNNKKPLQPPLHDTVLEMAANDDPVWTGPKGAADTISMDEPPKLWTGPKGAADTISMDEPPKLSDGVRIVLVGKTGAGKSSTGNTILGKEALEVSFSDQSVTKECVKVRGEVDGVKVSVVDTPGLFDTGLTQEEVLNRLVECITLSCPGPHVFLLVLKLGRFTPEDKKTVEALQRTFGDEASKYSIVLFTGGDSLSPHHTIEKFVKNAGPDLKQVLEKCSGRYVVFNNNNTNDRTQVSSLMDKIHQIKEASENESGFYTNDMYQSVERVIQEREEELRKEILGRHVELGNVMDDNIKRAVQEKEEELKKMDELVDSKNKEIDQLRSQLRDKLVIDVKKNKFASIKKATEQCKQQ